MATQEMVDPAQSTEDAGAEQSTLAPDNLSPLEAVAERIRSIEAEKEASQPDAEVEAEEETEEVEEVAAEEESEVEASSDEEDDDALAELSDEEREYLEENPESRLAKRIGKLVRERKEAQEALQAAQSQQQQQAETEPEKETFKPVENNPFADLADIEAVGSKTKELEDLREWMEDLLEDHEDNLVDDVIYTEKDAEFTKSEVRKRLRLVRKELGTFLPARKAELKQGAELAKAKEYFDGQAKEQIEWMSNEDSEEFKAYSEALGNKDFANEMAEIKRVAPKIASQMNWILAHFTNSVMGGQKAKGVELKPIKPSKTPPPSSPRGAASLGRGGSTNKKKLQALESTAERTGSIDDAVAARTFKIEHKL